MLFFESSFKTLFNSTVNAFPHTVKRQHVTSQIVIENIRWIPFLGLNTLLVKADAINEDRHYAPLILFKKVDYNGKGAKIKAEGMIYQFNKLSLENTDVLIRCPCQDFHWRFNYYDHLDKSLYGRKRAKYESQGGPPANPLELPGMCKHLLKMFETLKGLKVLTD